MRLRQTYLGCTATVGSKVTKALRNQTFNHSIDIPATGSACGEKNLAKGLFSKTNNTFGADFSRYDWSDGVSTCWCRAFGSNLVRMVLSRFPLAAGIRTTALDFTSNLAFVPRFGGQLAVASEVE